MVGHWGSHELLTESGSAHSSVMNSIAPLACFADRNFVQSSLCYSQNYDSMAKDQEVRRKDIEATFYVEVCL